MKTRSMSLLLLAALALMLVACDLSIEKTASRNPGVVGKPLVYTLAVKNTPVESAPISQNVSDVVVTDTLPQSVRFVSATAGQGTCERPNANRQVICDLETVNENQTVAVRITVVPLRVGTITNVASVEGDTTGFAPSPDISSQATPEDKEAARAMDTGELSDRAESRMAQEEITKQEVVEYDPQQNNTDSVTVRVVAPPNSNACTIIGTNQSEILRGTPGRDVICALGGNDIVYGFGGNDRIIGGFGNDILYGMAGNDALFGGPGNDVLRGGPGADGLNGGSGRNIVRQ